MHAFVVVALLVALCATASAFRAPIAPSASRIAAFTSGRLLKKADSGMLATLLRAQGNDGDDDYAFASKRRITRQDEGEYFESEVSQTSVAG